MMRAGSLRVDAPPGLGRSGGLAATERIRLLKFVSVFAVGGTERQVVTMAEGFQRAEFLVEHGMVDAIVARKDLKPYISSALKFFLA